MDQQIPSPDQSDTPSMGITPDYQSLLKDVGVQKARLAGIYEVYMCGCVVWNREKKILEEMEDKLELLRQGQLRLGEKI